MSINEKVYQFMTEVLFLYHVPVNESRRLSNWILLTIDCCICVQIIVVSFPFFITIIKKNDSMNHVSNWCLFLLYERMI